MRLQSWQPEQWATKRMLSTSNRFALSRTLEREQVIQFVVQEKDYWQECGDREKDSFICVLFAPYEIQESDLLGFRQECEHALKRLSY